MSVRTYTTLLRTKPVGYLMGTSIAARLPMGGASLALALIITKSGSYTRAGTVLAAYTIGAAISGPLLGRAVDRFGRARVLRPAAIGEGALLIVLSLLPVHWALAMTACGLCAGLSAPPIVSATRSLWRTVVAGDSLQTVFALEATLQELPFIAGPAFVAVITAVSTPRLALALSGIVLTVGVLVFSAHPAAKGAPPPPPKDHGARRRLPVALPVLLQAVLLVAAFSATELAVVRFAREHHAAAAAGVVLALWAAGSLSGGLAWGTRAGRPGAPIGRLAGLIALVAAGLALPAAATNVWLLGLMSLLSGMTIAPALGAVYSYVSDSTQEHRQTEAFGWLATGFQIGAAVGSGLGGLLVQGAGPRTTFLSCAGTVAVGAMVLAIWSVSRPQPTEPATSAETASQDFRAAISAGSHTGANGGA